MVTSVGIKRLKLESFRRFSAPLELHFGHPNGQPNTRVVLAGPNGCGKTTVLQSILWCLQMDASPQSAPLQQGWPTPHTKARVEMDIVVDNVLHIVNREGAGTPTVIKRDLLDSMVEIGPFKDSFHLEVVTGWRAPELVGPIKPLSGPGRRPDAVERNRLWRLKQRILDEQAARAFDKGGGPRPRKDQDWLKQLNDLWREFHPTEETRLATGLIETQEEQFADLFLIRRDGTRICPVDELSSGELELLGLAVVEILGPVIPTLILWDEPELHLHKEWQQKLAQHVARMPGQVIMATHSADMWDSAYSFERILLVPNDDPRREVFSRAAS